MTDKVSPVDALSPASRAWGAIGERSAQPRWGMVSMNSAPSLANRSFLRSLEMKTSMILGCG